MCAQAKKGVPIYVISGEADEVYPLSFVTECLARFQGFNIYHQIIPGLSHMESSILEECIAVAHLLALQGFQGHAGGCDAPVHLAKRLEREAVACGAMVPGTARHGN